MSTVLRANWTIGVGDDGKVACYVGGRHGVENFMKIASAARSSSGQDDLLHALIHTGSAWGQSRRAACPHAHTM